MPEVLVHKAVEPDTDRNLSPLAKALASALQQ